MESAPSGRLFGAISTLSDMSAKAARALEDGASDIGKNDENAANRINENHARELLELHTLGVDGGYQQRDVQELARVLTGFGSNVGGQKPNLRREWAGLYQQDGAFEFNPNRHDFGGGNCGKGEEL